MTDLSKGSETTVTIDTPGVTVTIVTCGHLDDVAAKALEVFQAAGGWPQGGHTQPTGFAQVERRDTFTSASSTTWEPLAPIGFSAQIVNNSTKEL